MARTCTLAELDRWTAEGGGPDWSKTAILHNRYLMNKRTPKHDIVMDINQVHSDVASVLHVFKGAFPDPEDLHLSGSWVVGTWSHPEKADEDALEIRSILGKPLRSDLDFFAAITPKEEAKKKLWSIADRIGWKCDLVGWWGPCVPIHGGPPRAANPQNKMSGKFKKLFVNN